MFVNKQKKLQVGSLFYFKPDSVRDYRNICFSYLKFILLKSRNHLHDVKYHHISFFIIHLQSTNHRLYGDLLETHENNVDITIT